MPSILNLVRCFSLPYTANRKKIQIIEYVCIWVQAFRLAASVVYAPEPNQSTIRRTIC